MDEQRIVSYFNRKQKKAPHTFKAGDSVIYTRSVGKSSHQVVYPAVITFVHKVNISISYFANNQVRRRQVTSGVLKCCSDLSAPLPEQLQNIKDRVLKTSLNQSLPETK